MRLYFHIILTIIVNAAFSRVTKQLKGSRTYASKFKEAPDEVEMVNNLWAFYDKTPTNLKHWRSPFPTFGMIWPRPYHMGILPRIFRVNINNLNISVSGAKTSILLSAVQRYKTFISDKNYLSPYAQNWNHQQDSIAKLADLKLDSSEVTDISHVQKLTYPKVLKYDQSGNFCAAGTTQYAREFCEPYRKQNADDLFNYVMTKQSMSGTKLLLSQTNAGYLSQATLHVAKHGYPYPNMEMDESCECSYELLI